jgi:hypothetical protein
LLEVAAQYGAYKQRAEAIVPQVRERFSMETCAQRYIDAYEAALRGATT